MRALVIEQSQRGSVFAIAEIEEPTCLAGELIIRV